MLVNRENVAPDLVRFLDATLYNDVSFFLQGTAQYRLGRITFFTGEAFHI